jgi:hypothetical protein
MFFDNLTFVGFLVAGFYALLPLLFGREFLKVKDDGMTSASEPSCDNRGGAATGPRRLAEQTSTQLALDANDIIDQLQRKPPNPRMRWRL